MLWFTFDAHPDVLALNRWREQQPLNSRANQGLLEKKQSNLLKAQKFQGYEIYSRLMTKCEKPEIRKQIVTLCALFLAFVAPVCAETTPNTQNDFCHLLAFEQLYLYDNLLKDDQLSPQTRKGVERSLYQLLFIYWLLAYNEPREIQKFGSFEILGSTLATRLSRENLAAGDPLGAIAANGSFEKPVNNFLSELIYPRLKTPGEYQALVKRFQQEWLGWKK